MEVPRAHRFPLGLIILAAVMNCAASIGIYRSQLRRVESKAEETRAWLVSPVALCGDTGYVLIGQVDPTEGTLLS